MALSLVAPTAAVTNLPNGIIVVRCKDYVGASAGASVVSDALSVVGTVVKEEQTIAVQTTFQSTSSLWASVDDTVSVPVADLGLATDIGYEIFVSCRTEGDPPTTALARCHQDAYRLGGSGSSGSTVGFGVGDDAFDMWDSPDWVARKHIDNYLLYDITSWDTDGSGATNLIVRAWGVTGGDVALYFDLIYLLPDYSYGVDDIDIRTSRPDNNMPLRFLANGVLGADDDNDAGSAPWLGKFSVLDWGIPWTDVAGIAEMQETDDETTAQVPDEDDTLYSYLAYIAGASHMPSHTIISDDMTETTTGSLGDGMYVYGDYVVDCRGGDVLSGFYDIGGGVNRRGWWLEGDGVARYYIPVNQSGPGETVRGRLAYAGRRLLANPNTDPTNWRAGLHLQSAIMTARFSVDVLQDSYFGLGLQKVEWNTIAPGFDSDANSPWTGAMIRVNSGGDLDLYIYQGVDTITPWTPIGPESIATGTSANTWVWLKAEKRGYFWRAKAWLDGDSEPDWMLDLEQALFAREGSFGAYSWIDYPWDDNWVLSVNNDTVLYDPRGTESFPTEASRPELWAGVGGSLLEMIVSADDFTVEYDPGSGTPGAVTTRTLKVDGTSLDASVSVPYGSHRFVQGPLAKRTFGSDGFNVRVVKDSVFPALSPAIMDKTWQKLVEFVQLVGDIKNP